MQLYGRTLHEVRVLEPLLADGTLEGGGGGGRGGGRVRRRRLIRVRVGRRAVADARLCDSVCDALARADRRRADVPAAGRPSAAG